jgi:hypothetical protein
VCLGSFLFFLLNRLKFNCSIERKNKVLHAGWHKNCDQKIKLKGKPGGRAKKTGEVLINAFKIK